jgi:hypothetical protein
MSRARVLPAVLLALCACSRDQGPKPPWGKAPNEPAALRASASPRETALLSPVRLEVDLWTAAGVEARLEPKVPAGFALAAGTRIDESRRELFSGTWRRWALEVVPTRTGELAVPPFEAKARLADGKELAVRSDEITVTSKPRLAEDKGEIEAPHAPYEPRSRWPELALWGAGGLAVLAALALLLRRWLRGRKRGLAREAAETALPPHVKALRALAKLRHEPRISAEQIERFYVEIAQILRVYLEERFGLRAPERTTEEFLVEARRSPLLTVEQGNELVAFLRQCDLVKFARVVPSDDAHLAAFATAERFVEATRADRAPAAREGAA